MGVVYKARDPHIGRLVAIKTITSAASSDTDHLQRFQREAQAAGALHHPNIVTIYEMGNEEGVPYLVMEYLDGEGLDRLIERQAPVPFLEKFSYLMQLCRALQHAHEQRVVHRDVKPANIMVKRDGTIRVVDFGIARLVDTTRTQTGFILGTIGYMSPQQLHGQRADERSDIWAAGVVAYELLAGRKPFTGENHAAMILGILSRTPEPLPIVAPNCPANLATIIERAMHKEDSQRYQNMGSMLGELEPVWKDAQQRGVNFMMEIAQVLLEKKDYAGVRKQLDQILRIDRESVNAAVLVENLRGARDGLVLQEELLELVRRGRQYLEDGLFSDAAGVAHDALKLDPQSKAARELLSEAEETDSNARRNLLEDSSSAPILEREYTVWGPRGVVARSSAGGPVPLAEARLITATEKTGATTKRYPGPETLLPSQTTVAVAARPARNRQVSLWVAGLVTVAAIIPTILYMNHVRKIGPAPQAQLAVVASEPEVPAAGSVEDRQRALMEKAHEAADQNDYAKAREQLDEAAKLNGPQGSRIEDLRRRFTEQEQNASIRAAAKQESDLWVQAQRDMQQNNFEDAGNAFRSIVALQEGRRKEDAQRFLQTVIPQRREEETLFSKMKGNPPPHDSAELQQETKLLDRIISLNGPRRGEAERMRRQITERLAGINSKAEIADPLTSVRPASTQVIPDVAKSKAPAETPPPTAIKSAPEESPDVSAFQKAVEHLEKASQSRDLNALKKEVLPEFEHIAQLGGLKAEDARRYLNVQIPIALRDATPWPDIGCPAAPIGLAMTIKSGDTVPCGLLDPPRLKWTRFNWPEFSAQGAIAMLSLTVNENGNVIDARPRGKPDDSGFLGAALSTARHWQTTPPRAQGKPVKTEFAVDMRSIP